MTAGRELLPLSLYLSCTCDADGYLSWRVVTGSGLGPDPGFFVLIQLLVSRYMGPVGPWQRLAAAPRGASATFSPNIPISYPRTSLRSHSGGVPTTPSPQVHQKQKRTERRKKHILSGRSPPLPSSGEVSNPSLTSVLPASSVSWATGASSTGALLPTSWALRCPDPGVVASISNLGRSGGPLRPQL